MLEHYVIQFTQQTKFNVMMSSGLEDGPSAWLMLNQDRQSRALVASSTQLFLLDHGGQYQEQILAHGSSSVFRAYTAMAVSFNNKYLALFTDTGLLWIGSSDMQVLPMFALYINSANKSSFTRGVALGIKILHVFDI